MRKYSKSVRRLKSFKKTVKKNRPKIRIGRGGFRL
nr:MAG: hypothetical protein [Microvirus sp.]